MAWVPMPSTPCSHSVYQGNSDACPSAYAHAASLSAGQSLTCRPWYMPLVYAFDSPKTAWRVFSIDSRSVRTGVSDCNICVLLELMLLLSVTPAVVM